MVKTKANKKKEDICPRVLFCFENPRLFRTTLIGYLYEIAQVWPVAVIGPDHLGDSDIETKNLLYNKKHFPKLEEITLIKLPYWGDVLRKNRKLHKKLKRTVKRCQPDIIITHTDMSLIGLYLMRFGKKTGALNLTLQAGFKMGESKDFARYSYLKNIHSEWSHFPLWLRTVFVGYKKYLGHFFYYWILPLMVGEKPFSGKSSSILIKGSSGMRDADYSTVFSKRDYGIATRDGVPEERLCILDHPLKIKEIRSFFKQSVFSNNHDKSKKKTKVFTLMFPTEQTGFRKNNSSIISKEEIQESRIKIVDLITKTIKNCEVFIKPHPAVAALPEEIKKEVDENLKAIRMISDSVKVVSPLEPADKYIEMSDVVVGIPPASTALYTTFLQCPQKTILSLDLDKELLGDSYKNFEGVEYIDNERRLKETLKLIKDGKYIKKRKEKSEGGPKKFNNTVELIRCLYKNRKEE